jgi:DNA-binding LytR/AlgR family response regulator
MKHVPPPQTPCIEVDLFSGDKVVLGPLETPRFLLHRYMLINYVLVAFCLTIIDTRSGLPSNGLQDQALLVTIAMAGAIALLLLVAVLLDMIARRRKRVLQIAASPVLAVAAVIGVLTGDIAEYAIVGYRTSLARSAVLMVFYYVVIEMLAHLFLLRTLPRVLRDLRSRGAAKGTLPVAPPRIAADVPDVVDIGGQKIPTKDLVRITAEGNYLRVQTVQSRLFLPGPFGRVVDQLPEQLGVRVSRSDWVALREVHALRRDEGSIFLDLKDGASVKVANTRQKLVTSLLGLEGMIVQGGAGETSSQMG